VCEGLGGTEASVVAGEVDELDSTSGRELDELDNVSGREVDELEVPPGKDEDVLLVRVVPQLALPESVTEVVVPPVVPSLLTTKLPQAPKSML
jgi:hypothetical protein